MKLKTIMSAILVILVLMIALTGCNAIQRYLFFDSMSKESSDTEDFYNSCEQGMVEMTDSSGTSVVLNIDGDFYIWTRPLDEDNECVIVNKKYSKECRIYVTPKSRITDAESEMFEICAEQETLGNECKTKSFRVADTDWMGAFINNTNFFLYSEGVEIRSEGIDFEIVISLLDSYVRADHLAG